MTSKKITEYQTDKAVYILITTAKDGIAITSLERKIALVTIKSIAMSNLRDDWLVRYRFTHSVGSVVLKQQRC